MDKKAERGAETGKEKQPALYARVRGGVRNREPAGGGAAPWRVRGGVRASPGFTNPPQGSVGATLLCGAPGQQSELPCSLLSTGTAHVQEPLLVVSLSPQAAIWGP